MDAGAVGLMHRAGRLLVLYVLLVKLLAGNDTRAVAKDLVEHLRLFLQRLHDTALVRDVVMTAFLRVAVELAGADQVTKDSKASQISTCIFFATSTPQRLIHCERFSRPEEICA